MKCIVDSGTGKIMRVTDMQAQAWAGLLPHRYQYVSKSAWKKQQQTTIPSDPKAVNRSRSNRRKAREYR